MNAEQLSWPLVRWRLAHGPVAWVLLAEALLALVLALAWIGVRDPREPPPREAPAIRRAVPALEPSQRLGLPADVQRLPRAKRLLALVQRQPAAPQYISFRVEEVAGTGLRRDVMVFKWNTSWSQLTRLLHDVETLDRAAYVSRLHVARETANDEVLTADVQIALAMHESVDSPGADGAPP